MNTTMLEAAEKDFVKHLATVEMEANRERIARLGSRIDTMEDRLLHERFDFMREKIKELDASGERTPIEAVQLVYLEAVQEIIYTEFSRREEMLCDAVR